jgi:hypothetical protein
MIGRPRAFVLNLVVLLAVVAVSSVPAIADDATDAKAKALIIGAGRP